MALRDAIRTAISMGSTQLGAAVKKVSELPHDRLIVVTDEQSADRVPEPKGLGYMINVASNPIQPSAHWALAGESNQAGRKVSNIAT
jgi:hypothetical protein